MAPRLKFDTTELEVSKDVTVFGRSEECDVPLSGNPNISRRHAQIERRGAEYFLEDLGSSNGTTVNGQPVAEPVRLNPGDLITLGNSVIVEFISDQSEDGGVAPVETGGAVPGKAAGSRNLVLGIAGGACGLAVLTVAGALAVPYLVGSSCSATAVFETPEAGETLTAETEVAVRVEGGACIDRVLLTVAGKQVASMSEEPYSTKIEADLIADYADGGIYPLEIVLVDDRGNRLPQESVPLAFETRKQDSAPQTKGTPQTEEARNQKGPASDEDVRKMSEAFLAKLPSSGPKYRVGGQELVAEVQKHTREYAAAGFFARASAFKDVINQAFVREKDLDPTLAYVLAFSRSRFDPAKGAEGEGLWKMKKEFATANFYDSGCGTESLSDPSQKCAARVAAVYLQELSIKIFDGDTVLAVAHFGRTTGEASALKAKLPADRSDLWRLLNAPDERERVARFIAAGIVAENPERFSLQTDKRLSELFPPPTR